MTVTVNKYVNVTGSAGTFSKTVDAGQAVSICVSDFGLSGVDGQRIALREASNGGPIGNFIAFGNAGCASFTPTSSKSVDGFVFSTVGGTADYSKVDGGVLNVSRHVAAFNSTTYPGNSTELEALGIPVGQFNAALAHMWMGFGGAVMTFGGGDIDVRFSSTFTACGFHSTSAPYAILINSPSCAAIRRNILGVMIEELFELLTRTSDIDRNGGSSSVVLNDNTLSEPGKAYLTYVYIKDPKGW